MTHKEINDQLQVHMLIEKKLNTDIVLATNDRGGGKGILISITHKCYLRGKRISNNNY